MNEIRVLGRWLADADLDQIRRLRQEPPEWSRPRLSVPLAGRWRWCKAAGRRKDRAARTPFLKRLARGLLTLPTTSGGTAPVDATGGARTGRPRQDCPHPLRTRNKSIWIQPLPPQFQHHLTTP